MFEKVNIPILGIVENMSIYVCPNCNHQEHIFGQGGGQKMCDQYGVEFLGSLPLNLSIREQADSGHPTVVSEPDGAISGVYKEIARKVGIRVADMSKDMSSKFPSIVVQNS
jgi:ATP-binding protein involved in chromosome partitioning